MSIGGNKETPTGAAIDFPQRLLETSPDTRSADLTRAVPQVTLPDFLVTLQHHGYHLLQLDRPPWRLDHLTSSTTSPTALVASNAPPDAPCPLGQVPLPQRVSMALYERRRQLCGKSMWQKHGAGTGWDVEGWDSDIMLFSMDSGSFCTRSRIHN